MVRRPTGHALPKADWEQRVFFSLSQKCANSGFECNTNHNLKAVAIVIQVTLMVFKDMTSWIPISEILLIKLAFRNQMRLLEASTSELFIQDDQSLHGRDGLEKQASVIYDLVTP